MNVMLVSIAMDKGTDSFRKWLWRLVWFGGGFVLGRISASRSNGARFAPSRSGEIEDASSRFDLETGATTLAGLYQTFDHIVRNPTVVEEAFASLPADCLSGWDRYKEKWPGAIEEYERYKKKFFSDRDAIEKRMADFDVSAVIRERRDVWIKSGDAPFPMRTLARVLDPTALLVAPPPTGSLYERFETAMSAEITDVPQMLNLYLDQPGKYETWQKTCSDFGIEGRENVEIFMIETYQKVGPILGHIIQESILRRQREDPKAAHWMPLSSIFPRIHQAA